MKKLLIATNVLLLGFIIIQSCNNKNKVETTGINTNGIKAPQTFCEDSACFNFDGSELRGMIDYQLAIDMSRDYADDDGKRFIWDGSRQTKDLDATCIWFDLKKIKTFIGYIESALCKQSCKDMNNYGVRMYFAKYPGKKDMQRLTDLFGVPLEYANHHTLFMVPTYWNNTLQRNIDFDPAKVLSDCKIVPMDSLGNIVMPWFKMNEDGSEQQNHGSLMPPPAGTGTFPTIEN